MNNIKQALEYLEKLGNDIVAVEILKKLTTGDE